jgi:hypothetical protein
MRSEIALDLSAYATSLSSSSIYPPLLLGLAGILALVAYPSTSRFKHSHGARVPTALSRTPIRIYLLASLDLPSSRYPDMIVNWI